MGKLNDTKLRSLKYDAERGTYQTYADGGGLYIKVTKSGARLWRIAYRHNGKQNHLACGQYPEVTLLMARERLVEVRRLLAEGKDPAALKREEKAKLKVGTSFEEVFSEWLEVAKTKRREATLRKYQNVARLHLLPVIGNRDIKQLTRLELSSLCKQIAEEFNTSGKVAAIVLNLVFSFAEDSGLVDANIASSIKRALPAISEGHFAAITNESGVAEILRKLEAHKPHMALPIQIAWQLLIYTAMRVGATVSLTWGDINLDDGTIQVAAREGTKTRQGFTVYLGPKMLERMRAYAQVRLSDTFVFPSAHSGGKHISASALKYVSKTADIGPEHSRHGWRQVLKTLANEHHVPSMISELALGHKVGSVLEDTYSRAKFERDLRKFACWYERALNNIRKGLPVEDWS